MIEAITFDGPRREGGVEILEPSEDFASGQNQPCSGAGVLL